MKVYPIHLTLLLVIVLCLSCCKHTPLPAELRKAEALMENHPDSALTVLEQISNTKHFDKAAQATYCLLLTQARDKNYIEHTSDSIIKIAVDYFDSHKDKERKAQSYYYLGRVYSDLYQTELAAESYLKALEFARQADSFKWIRVINNQLGKIYYNLSQFDNALLYYEEAYKNCEQIKDTVGGAYVSRNIAWIYEDLMNKDSALLYYNLALEQAKKGSLSSMCQNIYGDLANYYRYNQEYELAMRNISLALENDQSQDTSYRYYFIKGDLLYKMNHLDSAEVYLRRALASDNFYTKAQCYRLLSDLYAKNDCFKLSNNYLNEYIECRDSIEVVYKPQEIKKIEAEFNYQKARLLQERDALKNRMLNISFAAIAFICVICMVLGYSFYQRHLLQKEREISSLKRFVEQKEKMYKDNQSVIHKNNLLIIELKRTIDNLESSKERKEAESSINDLRNRIDNLEKENTLLNRKISTLTMDLLKEKKVLEYIESLPEGEVFSNVVWLKLQTKLREIEPNFFKNLKRVAPDLTLKEKQFCCFIRLSLTNQQIASHLNIDTRSVSRYKSKLVKERFGRSDKILLDDLLRLL